MNELIDCKRKGIQMRISAAGSEEHVEFFNNGIPMRQLYIAYDRNVEKYKHKYLSWDNFSYAFPVLGQDEEDDYLLNHALQDDQKTSLLLFTRNFEEVKQHFGREYSVVEKEMPGFDGFKQVYILREGCLSDFFSWEEIDDKYVDYGIEVDEVILPQLMREPISNLVSGKTLLNGVPFEPLMQIDRGGDSVTHTYGIAGIVTVGMLFGYPIESTVSLINCNSSVFINTAEVWGRPFNRILG